jgi:hypothetical protein
MTGAAPLLFAAEDEGSQLSDNNKAPSKMKQKVVKERAQKYSDNGGVSPSGRKYIHVDQKDIEAATKDLRKNGSGQGDKDRELDTGSTTINKGDKVRSVDIVVETDKKIDIKTDGKPINVNLGKVEVEDGALRHRNKVETSITVDAKKGILVH